MLMNSQVYIPNSDPLLNSKLLFLIIYSVSLLINPSYFTHLEQSIWSSPPNAYFTHRLPISVKATPSYQLLRAETLESSWVLSFIPVTSPSANPVKSTQYASGIWPLSDSPSLFTLTTNTLGVSHPHLSPGLWPYPSRGSFSPLLSVPSDTYSTSDHLTPLLSPLQQPSISFFSLFKKLWSQEHNTEFTIYPLLCPFHF